MMDRKLITNKEILKEKNDMDNVIASLMNPDAKEYRVGKNQLFSDCHKSNQKKLLVKLYQIFFLFP